MTTSPGAQGATDKAKSAARQAGDSPIVEWGARIGYAANGVLHLLLGWLALQVALGGSGKKADQSGALAMLARESWGQVLLWVLTAGFLLLAIWQLTEIFTNRDKGDKAKAAGKFVAYSAVGWTAFTFAKGGRTSSSKTTNDFTQTVLDWPGGQLLVAAIGLGIIGVGAYHVWKGWKQKFLEDLQEHPGTWAVWAGRVGYIAKGIALGAVGVLFVIGAFKPHGGKTTGLDGGLRALRDLPAGQIILILIALGLAAYGIYSFARARYART